MMTLHKIIIGDSRNMQELADDFFTITVLNLNKILHIGSQ